MTPLNTVQVPVWRRGDIVSNANRVNVKRLKAGLVEYWAPAQAPWCGQNDAKRSACKYSASKGHARCARTYAAAHLWHRVHTALATPLPCMSRAKKSSKDTPPAKAKSSARAKANAKANAKAKAAERSVRKRGVRKARHVRHVTTCAGYGTGHGPKFRPAFATRQRTARPERAPSVEAAPVLDNDGAVPFTLGLASPAQQPATAFTSDSD